MPLGKNADAGDYVDDFKKSDAPQFKGKSKEKRRKMAIAAYLDSKDKKESKMKTFDDIRAELNEAKYKIEIAGGIETVTARTEKEAIMKAAKAQGVSKSVNKPGGPKVKVTKISEAEEVKPHMMYDPKTGKSVTAKDKADHDKYAEMGYTHEKPEVKEISSNKLGNYMRKSAAAAAKPGVSARTQDKRIAGQSMADKKIRKKMGYSSTAKVPAGKNESVDEKKMDSAAMKRAMDAYKKRGGKVTKVAPGKAAGYHGKDDPGKDVQGMMDRGDTKGFNRKKKVKSMR